MVTLIPLALSFALANLAGAGQPAPAATLDLKDLPFTNVHAIAKSGDQWLMGGAAGLSIGQPGKEWQSVSGQAVRQMVSLDHETWVLYGNGSVDKLDVAADRLYYDVLNGAVKRPQASSLSASDKSLVIGLFGGYAAKTGDSPVDQTYPDLLSGQSITAITTWHSKVALGSQKALYLLDPVTSKTPDQKVEVQKYSFTQGMPDVWVTALLADKDRLFVATASGGLATLKDGKIETLDCPSKRIRYLTKWNNRLVVGGLEGAFLQPDNPDDPWQTLVSGETTCLQVIDGDLYVGRPEEIKIFKTQPNGQGVK